MVSEAATPPPEEQPRPEVFIGADEENQEVSIGVDIDGDGKPDFEKKFTIDDPRVWAIIGWIIAGVSITKNLNIW